MHLVHGEPVVPVGAAMRVTCFVRAADGSMHFVPDAEVADGAEIVVHDAHAATRASSSH